MFTVSSAPVRLCDGVSRREMLRIGSLGLAGMGLFGMGRGGVGLAELARAASATPPESAARRVGAASLGKAKNCIVLFLMGGPPQQSTWDPKPDAPAEVRGEFGPLQTRVPGMLLADTLPKTAEHAERLCLLRAVHTGDNAHSSSGYFMMTGQPHAPMNRENANPGAPNDWPNLGALVRRLDDRAQATLPAAVRLPHHIFNTDGSVWPGQDAGFLGRTSDPWLFRCEPGSASFQIPEFTLPGDIQVDRLSGRRSLLSQLNAHRASVERGGALASYDSATQTAFDLLTSSKSRAAFSLDAESNETRDRYGRTQFGQSVLLARRLVEAGVTLVQVNWFRGADEPSDAPCWDSHAREALRLRTALAPPFDAAFSALLTDLKDRNLLDETLVVCLSEFGRSPKINAQGGRDHWGNVFSVCLAGGGIRGGMVHGASDSVGGEPKEGMVRPEDLLATLFHSLGYPSSTTFHDSLGRPIPITRGEPIKNILG
jgi:hypothetical protein